MSLIYIVIWGFVALAGLTSVTALVWSIRHGQWRATAQDANVIFNLDDSQPDAGAPRRRAALSTRGE